MRKAPTTTELDAARIGGVDALKALAQRFPEDAAVLQALAVADARDKKGSAATDVLRHLLEIAPDRSADKDVQAVLIELANGPPEVAPEAFTLLETKMGAAGADILYELRERAGSSKIAKDRAAADLAKPEVLKSASKALRVAEELRSRSVCARKELVPRAAADGDGRALPHLRGMLAPKGCGGFSIFHPPPECACLSAQDRGAISAAIESIQKRDGGEH